MGDAPDDPIQCLCPEGSTHFEKCGDPARGPWAPSPDRWPLPGRRGGEYVPDNVRLTHLKCNSAAGCYAGGKKNVEVQRANGFPNLRPTTEQRRDAGKKSVEVQRANGTGIFGMSAEQRRDGGKTGGRASAALRVACGEPGCDVVANHGNIAKHVRATGHVLAQNLPGNAEEE